MVKVEITNNGENELHHELHLTTRYSYGTYSGGCFETVLEY